jgi:2-dehydro-3-deoxyphosphogluconate aldolase/(4S)-4-hydroxy-2-oxoglutarate aldolase
MIEHVGKMKTLDLIHKYKVISIIRGLSPEYILKTVQALYDGGIRLVEVTFNQKSKTCIEDGMKSISIIKKNFGDDITVGAGTVMNLEQVCAAKNAEATYILAANVNKEVIKLANALDMVSIPGAYTPTEIAEAYEAGADIIKLFPASEMGISYIKAITAPLNHIPMMAVGGINESNMMDFLNIGLNGVGVGSNIVKNSIVLEGKYNEITKRAKLYTNQINTFF